MRKSKVVIFSAIAVITILSGSVYALAKDNSSSSQVVNQGQEAVVPDVTNSSVADDKYSKIDEVLTAETIKDSTSRSPPASPGVP